MNQGKARHPSAELVTLMRLEEGARSCTTREQARALIREADQVKRHPWGTIESSIASQSEFSHPIWIQLIGWPAWPAATASQAHRCSGP